MEIVFFSLIAVTIAGYIVLDGFDLSAGLVQAIVARSDAETRTLLDSTAPVCGGKEVWLLAALGAVSFAFSGFSLALAIVLWLLIVHGVSIQLRSRSSSLSGPVRAACFAGLSILLALFCGASLGKLLRGTAALDWYTFLVGSVALCALTMHGALWVAMKSASPVRERAALLAHRMWWALATVTMAAAAATLAIQPGLVERFAASPWGYSFPVIAMAGLLGVHVCKAPQAEALAYLSSCGFLTGLLASIAFSAGSLPSPVLSGARTGMMPGLLPGMLPGVFVAAAWVAFSYRRSVHKSAV
jgi:cytochrome d ubiquinol oxidase subunit II